MRILVTGAGGFIGHNLVCRLVAEGHHVCAVDIKPHPDFEPSPAQEYVQADLRSWQQTLATFDGSEPYGWVFALAADMGGMGHISTHHYECLRDNARINQNTAEAALQTGVSRLLYASSACVYPEDLQLTTDVVPLAEIAAWQGKPDTGYGIEKLASEALYDYAPLDTRLVRFHNIYGERGTYEGGREKAPAAMCRKVAAAKLGDTHQIEVWGDGYQTRSFCYIADALDGILTLMRSDYAEPLNIGSEEMVTINHLAMLAAKAADWDIKLVHVDGPQGVRGRNSDNTLCRQVLGWEPRVSLEDGMRRTYEWIEAQMRAVKER